MVICGRGTARAGRRLNNQTELLTSRGNAKRRISFRDEYRKEFLGD